MKKLSRGRLALIANLAIAICALLVVLSICVYYASAFLPQRIGLTPNEPMAQMPEDKPVCVEVEKLNQG